MPRASDGLSRLFGLSALTHLVTMARATIAPSLRGYASVLRRPLMPVDAMSLGQHNLFVASDSLNRSAACPITDFCARLLHGHPFGQSSDYGISLKPARLGQIRNRNQISVEYDRPSAASIILLLFAACPSAIFRTVTKIVIYTIKRISRWARPHVGQKILERVQPSLADFNPPSAVTIPMFGMGVIASAFHSLPDRVKRVWILERHKPQPLTSLGTQCHVMLTE